MTANKAVMGKNMMKGDKIICRTANVTIKRACSIIGRTNSPLEPFEYIITKEELTVGKSYIIVDLFKHRVGIINDKNRFHYYNKDMFNTLVEQRKQKIMKLCF